jgi:hypothetical protein
MLIPFLRYMGTVCLIGAVVSVEAQMIVAAITPPQREPFRCFENWPSKADWCPKVRVG